MSRWQPQSVEERFDEKWMPVPWTGCWLWTASLDGHGYGQFNKVLSNGKWGSSKAYKFSYERAKGPVPDGLQIDHLCRERSCVNPDHLEAVTQKENILRGTSPAAMNLRKNHCSKGHEWTEDNVALYKGRRGRMCKQCNRDSANRYYARKTGRMV